MPNILDSYLVSLGAVVDGSSFQRFSFTLRDAERAVDKHTSGMSSMFIKFWATSVAATTAVGFGLIALADKISQADQQYRLFGMRMLMTKDSARAMQDALDELGATIDEVSYDPELNARFHMLYDENMRLLALQGDTYNQNMFQMRTLRVEYERLKEHLSVLAGMSISKLFEKLGFGSGDLQKKLDDLNEYIEKKMPDWSDIISNKVIPAWNQFKFVIKDVWDTLKGVAGAWAFVTGVFAQDKAIKDSKGDWNELAHALQDTLDWLTTVALGMNFVVKMVTHLGSAFAAYGSMVHAWWKNDWDTFNRQKEQWYKESYSARRDAADLFTTDETEMTNNPDMAAIQKWRHYVMVDRPAAQKKAEEEAKNPKPETQDMSGKYVEQLAIEVSRLTGIPSEFILAQWQLETDNLRSLKGTYNFGNVTEVNKEDPKKLKFKNFESGLDFARYLAPYLLRKYPGIGEAATDEERVEILRKGNYFGSDDSASYLGGIRRYERENLKSKEETGDVHIGVVNINVPKSIPDHEVSRFVRESFKEMSTETIRNSAAQVATGAHY